MKFSNNKKKPEEEEDGTACQDISGKKEKAKSNHILPCIPPAKQILRSTEEQELEKSMKMQQGVMEMWKKNEEFKKLAPAGAGQPVNSVSQITKSVNSHFYIDEKIKQHPKSQEGNSEVNFTPEQ